MEIYSNARHSWDCWCGLENGVVTGMIRRLGRIARRWQNCKSSTRNTKSCFIECSTQNSSTRLRLRTFIVVTQSACPSKRSSFSWFSINFNARMWFHSSASTDIHLFPLRLHPDSWLFSGVCRRGGKYEMICSLERNKVFPPPRANRSPFFSHYEI